MILKTEKNKIHFLLAKMKFMFEETYTWVEKIN